MTWPHLAEPHALIRRGTGIDAGAKIFSEIAGDVGIGSCACQRTGFRRLVAPRLRVAEEGA